MSPREAIAHANNTTGPVIIFCANSDSQKKVDEGITQLTATLLKGGGAVHNGNEAMRFRNGEVDIIIATRTHLVGIVLWRDDNARVEVIYAFDPTPEEIIQGDDRVNRKA